MVVKRHDYYATLVAHASKLYVRSPCARETCKRTIADVCLLSLLGGGECGRIDTLICSRLRRSRNTLFQCRRSRFHYFQCFPPLLPLSQKASQALTTCNNNFLTTSFWCRPCRRREAVAERKNQSCFPPLSWLFTFPPPTMTRRSRGRGGRDGTWPSHGKINHGPSRTRCAYACAGQNGRALAKPVCVVRG